MKEEDIQRIIKEAVHETLCGLGFSTNEPQELQADMLYIRHLREGSDAMQRHIKFSILTVFIPALMYGLWESAKLATKIWLGIKQ